MLEGIAVGASVSMTPPEVKGLLGDGRIRLVTCADGRVVGGMGNVGLVEHVGVTDIQQFVDEINAKRAALEAIASGPQPENPRASLYTFTRI